MSRRSSSRPSLDLPPRPQPYSGMVFLLPMRWLRSSMLALLGFILTATLSADFSPADDYSRLRGIVNTVVQPVLAEHAIPGLVVALAVDGKSFFFSYDTTTKEGGTPIDENTLFEIGSVSKTFTATLAAYAQVQGKLSFDDHPSRYLPELQDSPIDGVTLLQLGTFTAGGLPLQFPADVTDEKQMIRYFQHWQQDTAPGQQRKYSNPSIGLLGHLTALALKTDFTEAMETRLLPALGLAHTFIRVPEPALVRYAWGYDAKNQHVRVTPGVFAAEAYGIKSTAADMIRFVQLNIDSVGLESPLRRAIEQTHVGYFQVGDMVQGLGWEQYPYPVGLKELLAGNSRAIIMESNPATPLSPPRAASGPTLFNKTGSTNGFGAYVVFVPEMKIGLVMLANKNYPIPARVKAAHAILESVRKSKALENH